LVFINRVPYAVSALIVIAAGLVPDDVKCSTASSADHIFLNGHEMPHRFVDIPWVGITLENGLLHPVHLTNDDFGVLLQSGNPVDRFHPSESISGR